MFASTSFSSVVNNTEMIFSSSSSFSSSPPGSPCANSGQKRAQRTTCTKHFSNQVISPSLSTQNMVSIASQSSTTTTTTSAHKILVPKYPKPQRTILILDSVITGLNLCIDDLKQKVYDLTHAVTNGYTAMTKQLLQSESYLRHLELRISNLQMLKNSYMVHLKMRDGIQNMFEAYKKSSSKNKTKNLNNIKCGWRDCIHTLCLIEAQTEALLGTFRFQIEKLIGFARLCPGDVYEIQIKYGAKSKFRTRTKITKDNQQNWDNTNVLFKITLHDLLLIKINEIKFFGKNILIGERICDTKDLFSTTQTQRLTLNANTSGTIKLSMLITWLPFENCEESFIYYNPTQLLTLKTKEKRSTSLINQPRPNSLDLKHKNDLNSIEDQEDQFNSYTNDDININLKSESSTSTTTSYSSSKLDENCSRSIKSNDNLILINESGSLNDIIPHVELLINDLIDKLEQEQEQEQEAEEEEELENFNLETDKRLLSENLFNQLKNLLDESRSDYIELNQYYDCLKTFNIYFNKSPNMNDSNLNLNDESINLDQVLHEYFDFLNLETDDSFVLNSNSSNSNQTQSDLDLNPSNDSDLLLIIHFKQITNLLSNLNLISKKQDSFEFRECLEFVLLDKLGIEFELLKKIKSNLNNKDYFKSKFNFLNSNNFCSDINKIKDYFINGLSISDKLVRYRIEFMVDKYLENYSFKLDNSYFISLFYFESIIDLIQRLIKFILENSNEQEENDKFLLKLTNTPILENCLNTDNNCYQLEIFLYELIESISDEQILLHKFLNLNKSNKKFFNLVASLYIKLELDQDQYNKNKTVNLRNCLKNFLTVCE